MNNDGWKDFKDHPVTEAKHRRILVWHVFQGALVCLTRFVESNSFNVRWRELPEDWIKTSDRLPDQEDADFFNCVIARERTGAVYITGYHDVTERVFEAWQRVPDPPKDYKELILNG